MSGPTEGQPCMTLRMQEQGGARRALTTQTLQHLLRGVRVEAFEVAATGSLCTMFLWDQLEVLFARCSSAHPRFWRACWANVRPSCSGEWQASGVRKSFAQQLKEQLIQVVGRQGTRQRTSTQCLRRHARDRVPWSWTRTISIWK